MLYEKMEKEYNAFLEELEKSFGIWIIFVVLHMDVQDV